MTVTLAREIARVHAARVSIGFYGKPITHTLLKAADWDGTTSGLRSILAHYRDEFARESDRHRVGNAHLGRLEIWAGSRWPDASDAWKWGYRWTEGPTGRLAGAGFMEVPDNTRITPGWWLVAALLDHRPILDASDPERIREWAPEILRRVLAADNAGGLAGLALGWVQAALREVDPTISVTPPVEVTPEHVQGIHAHAQAGRLDAVIAVDPNARVEVLPSPREGWRPLYTAADHVRQMGEYWLSKPMDMPSAARCAGQITDDANEEIV
ncbi:hypothetical protein [Nocardiopsis synnemataformans]|uniref:hypothetical protein n=1 Tax=Nocardiopsis synnemataformans TaxID=61305 RepID=UPI003EBB371F